MNFTLSPISVPSGRGLELHAPARSHPMLARIPLGSSMAPSCSPSVCSTSGSEHAISRKSNASHSSKSSSTAATRTRRRGSNRGPGVASCLAPEVSEASPGSQQAQASRKESGLESRDAAPNSVLVETVPQPAGRSSRDGRKPFAYAEREKLEIRNAWTMIMRWSRALANKEVDPLQETRKIVVFGGGSFATAMATAVANQKADLDVVMLLRSPEACVEINELHQNLRYLKGHDLPHNIRATTNADEAISGAQYVIHAVPVQSSRAFLKSVKGTLPPDVPIICVSKGLEIGTGLMMSEVIAESLGRFWPDDHPAAFLSGPSFAKEVAEKRPTGMVSASRDYELNRKVQALFASQSMRVNTTSDVVGVEICGALKNVLAIAAGIVEGLGLGHNSMAALVVQGCSEIRWLAEKAGAKPTTISGLAGLGDIMLTCYGSLSRNRSVGVRLGKGEKLEDILASSSQVAEGVATAGAVVSLAKRYRVSLPVLTAVAGVLSNSLEPEEALESIMNLPQIEEF